MSREYTTDTYEAKTNSKNPLLESFFGIQLNVGIKEYGKDNGTYFNKIEGGEMSITLIEHNVVYQNGSSSTLFIPGPTSFAPITLYQGVTDDKDMWKWWSNVAAGKKERKNAHIIVYGEITDPDSTADPKPTIRGEVARWSLLNVWPLKISGFSLDLDSTSAMVAAITLVAETIEREK